MIVASLSKERFEFLQAIDFLAGNTDREPSDCTEMDRGFRDLPACRECLRQRTGFLGRSYFLSGVLLSNHWSETAHDLHSI